MYKVRSPSPSLFISWLWLSLKVGGLLRYIRARLNFLISFLVFFLHHFAVILGFFVLLHHILVIWTVSAPGILLLRALSLRIEILLLDRAHLIPIFILGRCVALRTLLRVKRLNISVRSLGMGTAPFTMLRWGLFLHIFLVDYLLWVLHSLNYCNFIYINTYIHWKINFLRMIYYISKL
jgi:hypothetical protein